MRKFIGIVVLFFALAFSLLLDSSANQTQIIRTSDSIQIKKEAVEFVAYNILDSKTITYKAKSNKKLSSLTPLALSYHQTNCLQGGGRAEYIGCFIQNRTTEKQKIHQIRAP